MDAVNVVEARKRFSELVARVAFRGARVIIRRRGRPMAALISIDDLRRLEACERGLAALARATLARERGLAALGQARRTREAILAERQGKYLPDSADLIREVREERDDELGAGLR